MLVSPQRISDRTGSQHQQTQHSQQLLSARLSPARPDRCGAHRSNRVDLRLQTLEVAANLRRVLITTLAVDLEAPGNNSFQRWSVLDGEPDRGERPRSRRHLIEHYSQCPDVRTMIDRTAGR